MYSGIGIPRKGDLIYKDVNGDGAINEKDLSPIGKGTLPTGFTTIRAGFSWKGLELDLMFQGVTGYYGSVAYQTERDSRTLCRGAGDQVSGPELQQRFDQLRGQRFQHR